MPDQMQDVALNLFGSFIAYGRGFAIPVYIVSGANIAGVTGAGKLDTAASVTATINFDPIAGSPLRNPFGGSVMLVGGINSTTGSVAQVTVTSNKLDVNATATVNFDSVAGSPLATHGAGSVLLLGAFDNTTGSIASLRAASNALIVDNVSGDILLSQQFGTWTVNADTTTADYISVVGSPNYNLPVIGSIQVSSVVGALPAGTTMLGSANIREERFSTGLFGSVWVTTSSTNILQPRERQMFTLVPTGSVSAANVSNKIWVAAAGSISVNMGIELVQNQIWGLTNYTGSVSGITDAGSVCVGYNEV